MPLIPGPVKGKAILRQLKADLIGKDSFRGVTLSYSWLANQFGHYGLGNMPTLGVYVLLRDHTRIRSPALWAAIFVSITWLAFETYNFLGPLLLNRQSSTKLMFIPSRKKYIFQPAFGNIAFDTITDLCFFWLGAFGASLFIHSNLATNLAIGFLIVALLYPAFYWYRTKIYQQSAVYPFQFRLSQWDLPITGNDQATVMKFMNSMGTPNHLLIFGGRRCGKTSLGVGLANEFSIKNRPCTYTTAMKLYLLFFETDAQIIDDNGSLWTWRNNDVLVIDDINPGPPVRDDIVSPAKFLELLDTYLAANPTNRKAITEKKVIWIMGQFARADEYAPRWKEMLTTLGVPKESVFTVDLGSIDPRKAG